MQQTDPAVAGPPRHSWLSWLDSIEIIVADAALIISFAAVLLGIISRELFNAPIVWSEELARLAFVYVVFIGMSEAYARTSHLRVEIIDMVIHPKLVLILRMITHLIIGCLAAVLLWYGWQQASRSHMLQSLILSWPLSITYAALPFAMFLMLLRTPLMIWRDIKALRSC